MVQNLSDARLVTSLSDQNLSSGPYGANIFDPRSWGNDTDEVTNNITLEFTRIVIAIGVFAIGVELPKKYMYRHWKSLFFLLVPVMTWVRFALYIPFSVRG
jgi:sodium/hydrogen antiporter